MLNLIRPYITTIFLFLISLIAHGQQNQIEQKTIDKEDGFYATINYNADAPELALELEEQPTLTLKHIKKVKTIIGNYTNRREIAIRLTKQGGEIFKELTKMNIGKPIAIVLDKKIVYAPLVQSEIDGGRVVISGNFRLEEIDTMVLRLKSK